MIKIRYARGGVKNDPFYRIVAIDHQRKNTGKPLEVLGYWYPRKDDYKINKKAVQEWIKKGAQISPSVKKLLKEKK